jgi:dTDP-4-amino-4,6-dideoxygalactose transaminase
MNDPRRIPLVDLTAQYHLIADELRTAMEGVLATGEVILGEAVTRFEEEFAAYLGAGHAVGVGSGLDALRLSLTALGVGTGDEVILPANTYIATALAVSGVGATPVLVDCCPETYQFDVSRIEAAITSRTKAVIPVHMYGSPADLDSLLSLARSRSLAVIEDAAQAHGACLNGRFCGTLGDVGCFSFYPAKNLGAYGDGGIAVTQNAELAQRLRELRNYGQRAKNVHTVKGVNSRLDAVQAAILRVKLRYLDAWNQQRRVTARRYRELLPANRLIFPDAQPGAAHVYHLFVVRTPQRDRLRAHLEREGIQTGIHYPTPIHLQPAYDELGLRSGAFPVAERLSREVLSLPMYPELTEAQVQRVATSVLAFFA